MRSAALLLVLAICGVAVAQLDTEDRSLATSDGGRFIGPVEPLIDGAVSSYWVSPDGVAVVAVRDEITISPAEPRARELVYCWIASGNSRVLASGRPSDFRDVEVVWTADLGAAAIAYTDNAGALQLARAGPIEYERLGAWPGPWESAELVASPAVGRFALLQVTPEGELLSDVYSATGDPHGHALLLAEALLEPQVSADGSRIRIAEGGIALDLASAEFVTNDASEYPSEEAGPIELELVTQIHELIRGNHVERVPGLWVQATKPPPDDDRQVLITLGAESSRLSENCAAIAFVRDRALFACLVHYLTPEQLREHDVRQRRTEELENVKIIATALVIWSANNEDKLPLSLQAASSYLRDPAIDLSKYTFHLAEQDQMQIPRPSQTEMVSIRLDGGRIVGYADTSVRWVPDE